MPLICKQKSSRREVYQPSPPDPPIQTALRDKGELLYRANCQSCHEPIDRQSETRTVEAFDMATKERMGSVELDFTPTRMFRMGDTLALLNSGSETEPLFVLDSGGSPQVYFVPAGREQ